MAEYTVVGKRLPRVDGPAMATGEASYTGDIARKGTLIGKILRSPHPHARIVRVDTRRAGRLSGVKAIITAEDLPEVRFGVLTADPRQQDIALLARDRVRFIGEEVAAVAAVDEDTALEALERIEVEYEELPAVFTLEDALMEGAPQLHEHAPGNVAARLPVNYGEVEAGFRQADLVREDRFILAPLHQGFLETHISLAEADAVGRLTVWVSHQAPYLLREDLARALGMREGKIRVIKPFMGGGHCGKFFVLSNHLCSAALALKARRPVKVELTREEVFTINRGAQPMWIEVRTGVRRDGTLTAQDIRLTADIGAYVGGGSLANAFVAAMYTLLPYRLPHLRFECVGVYTNNPTTGAQRGAGGVSIRIPIEVQVDKIAQELGLDPLEIRLRNALRAGESTPTGLGLRSWDLAGCLKEATGRAGWSEKRAARPTSRSSSRRYGIGLACTGQCSGVKLFSGHNASAALVYIHEDGTVSLLTGAPDLGQGSNTALSQIAAEELGVELDDIRITSADTEITPIDLGSFGSRGTMAQGNAVRAAAADARRELLGVAAELLDAAPEELEVRKRRIFVRRDPTRGIPVADAVRAAQRSAQGKPILGKGYANPESDVPNPSFRGDLSPAYGAGATVAEVEVDEETGQVRVLRITHAWDCGYPINPLSVEGQIEGQVGHGLGQGLYEQRILEAGQQLNPSFLSYSLPTAADMPAVSALLVETNDPRGPFGAKECSEGPQKTIVPAILNAIHDATGVWVQEVPVTPERLLNSPGRGEALAEHSGGH